MKSITLQAIARPKQSGNFKEEGFVSAGIYGKKIEAAAIKLNAKQVDEIIAANGDHSEVTLEFAGVTMTGIIKEVQRNIMTQFVSHVDIHILG